jgi:hypothetical protein
MVELLVNVKIVLESGLPLLDVLSRRLRQGTEENGEESQDICPDRD